MGTLFISLIVVSALGLIVGWAYLMDKADKEAEEKKPRVTSSVLGKIDLSIRKDVMNHTYLPLNIGGIPADNVLLILGVLDYFEEENPELEVTSWSIEKQQFTHTVGAYIFGLWVNHRPKK